VSRKDIAFAQGRLEGIRKSGWACGHCGNVYDINVDRCLNQLLDEAIAAVEREEVRHRAGKGNTVSDPETKALPSVALLDSDGPPAPGRHLPDCPCEHGSCCVWMGECVCQCQCDFIGRIEDRVRAEYDPSESDAGASYRAGYDTAVVEFMSNHGDDAMFRLGYGAAMLDFAGDARGESIPPFASAQKLVEDLNEGQCSVLVPSSIELHPFS